jgi:hypothetical protein
MQVLYFFFPTCIQLADAVFGWKIFFSFFFSIILLTILPKGMTVLKKKILHILIQPAKARASYVP